MKSKKKLSLTFIIILLCFILIFAPVISSILYFNTSVAGNLKDTAKETASFYINQLEEDTSSQLDILRGCIYYLMSDQETLSIMRSVEAPSQADRLEVEQGLNRAFFLGNQLDSTTVTGIFLKRNDEQCLPILRGGMYIGSSTRARDVFEMYQGINSAKDLYVDPDYPDYCYMIVDYFDLSSMEPLGKIIIELSISELINPDYLTSIYKDSSVIMRSSDGRILTSMQNGFTEETIRNTADHVDVDGNSYYHVSRKLSSSNLAFDVYIPFNEILKSSNKTIRFYICFTSLVLIITLAAGSVIAYFLYKPLRQMLRNINCIANGELNVRMEETPYRETEHMAAAFNNMVDNLESLFHKVYEQGLLLRDSEFKLLEAQINPHFIFNILELINIRCMEHGETDICKMVTNLAELIRANVTNKHEQIISFREELNYVRYYLELQKERFAESLNYSIDLEDPSILNYYLPKLTIQPLVENSIVHGLEPKRGGGTVRVIIWEEENEICIRVSDDGTGFDAASIDLDSSADERTGEPTNHIALANIRRRIQLLYGERYDLKIDSCPGKGTSITVNLPICTEKTSFIDLPDTADMKHPVTSEG